MLGAISMAGLSRIVYAERTCPRQDARIKRRRITSCRTALLRAGQVPRLVAQFGDRYGCGVSSWVRLLAAASTQQEC